jgi:trehalose utilization protein
VFYFSPGHETYPIFHQPEVLHVISNGIQWAAPSSGPEPNFGHFPEPIEDIEEWEGQIEIQHPNKN